jgi:hypothetical protein
MNDENSWYTNKSFFNNFDVLQQNTLICKHNDRKCKSKSFHNRCKTQLEYIKPQKYATRMQISSKKMNLKKKKINKGFVNILLK